MIRFSCPKCQKMLKAPANGAGRRTACPRCGERFRVPGQATTGLGEPVADLASSPPSSTIIVKCPGCGRDIQCSPDELSMTFECAQCYQRFVPVPPRALASPCTAFDTLTEEAGQAAESAESQEQQDDLKTGPVVVTGWTAQDLQIVISIGLVIAACLFAILGVGVFVVIANTSKPANGEPSGTLGGMACFGGCMLLIAIVLLGVIARAREAACPRCRLWWARTSGTSELIGEEPTWKTVTRTIRHYDRRGDSAGRSEYDQRVPAVARTYRHYFSCKHCGHSWMTTTVNVS
jgi:hypothetical protein